MGAGDNLLKAIVNVVFWLTVFVQKFYAIFHIIGLLGILFVFSIAGGWVFQMVEAPIENRTIQYLIHQRGGTIDQFRTKVRNREPRSEVDLYVQEYEFVYINAIITGIFIEKGDSTPLWTLTGAIYYCVTTYTLIGFGNLAPRTDLGRLIAIFYSGISIPVGTLILGELGDFIVKGLKLFYLIVIRFCRCQRKTKNAPNKEAEAEDEKKSSGDKKDKKKERKEELKKVKKREDKAKKDSKKLKDKKGSGKKKDKKESSKKKKSNKKSDKKKSDKKSKKDKKNKSRNNRGDDTTDSYTNDQDSSPWQTETETEENSETNNFLNGLSQRRRSYQAIQKAYQRQKEDKIQIEDLKWVLNMCRLYGKHNCESICASYRRHWGHERNTIDARDMQHFTSHFVRNVRTVPQTEHPEFERRREKIPCDESEARHDTRNLLSNSNSTFYCRKEFHTTTDINEKDTHRNSDYTDYFVGLSTSAQSRFTGSTPKTTNVFVTCRNNTNERKRFSPLFVNEPHCPNHAKIFSTESSCDRTNSTQHTNEETENVPKHQGKSGKNRWIMPPTDVSLFLLASPFRWLFVGNVIRKILHKVMCNLKKQYCTRPESMNTKHNRNFAKNATAVSNKQGSVDERGEINLVSTQKTRKSNVEENFYPSNMNLGIVAGENNLRNRFYNESGGLNINLTNSSNNYAESTSEYAETASESEGGYDSSSKSVGTEDGGEGGGEGGDDDEEEEEGAPVMGTIIVTSAYIIIGGITLAHYSDNLKILQSIWFLYISMVTIGYGDVVPSDQILFIFILPYIFIGLSLMSSVLNDVTSYFTNNIIRARHIGQEVQQIIATTRNVQIAAQKRQRARARWDFVRATVWKGNLPDKLIEEAKWHKIHVFAKERELIRKAYSLYFYKPPCPESIKMPENEDEFAALLESIQKKGAYSPAKAYQRMLMKRHESTIDVLMNRYFTLWQRIRRWLVRKFYEVRNIVTGDSIPSQSPETERKPITFSRTLPVFEDVEKSESA